MGSNDNYRRFPRLKGSENWEPWSIRTKSTLIKEKLTLAIVLIRDELIKPIIKGPPTDVSKKAYIEYKVKLR